MRILSSALSQHLAEAVTTLALCVRITRADGVILGFTAHDFPLWFEGLAYRPQPSLTPSAIRIGGGLSSSDVELTGALSDPALSEADLLTGRYDGARIELFLLNWADVTQGRLDLTVGALGDVTQDAELFSAQMAGLFSALEVDVADVTSPECRADLGDARCRVPVAEITLTAEVTSLIAPDRFGAAALSQDAGHFGYGRLLWLSGANAGLEAAVLASSPGELRLREPARRAIAVGDLFEAQAGCDKRFSTCRTKFANQLNFRGEPHVPGLDAIVRYPSL
jgi:uncharacterized phage protein (TIGR02218 family)